MGEATWTSATAAHHGWVRRSLWMLAVALVALVSLAVAWQMGSGGGAARLDEPGARGDRAGEPGAASAQVDGGGPPMAAQRVMPRMPAPSSWVPAAPLANNQAVLAHVAQAGEAARRQAPAEAPRSPQQMLADLARDPAVAMPGRRWRVQGRLEGWEAGENGVAVLHLATDGQAEGLRVVMAPGAHSPVAGAQGAAVSLDCLSLGVAMGTWMLADCAW